MDIMSKPFPYSDAAPPPFSRAPTKSRQRNFEFTATLTLVVTRQGLIRRLPEGVTELGLLFEVPSPEGQHGLEPTDGYRRQPINFGCSPGHPTYRNTAPVVFKFGSEVPQVRCAVLFIDGIVYFYGLLKPACLPGHAYGDEPVIALNSGSLALAFCRSIG